MDINPQLNKAYCTIKPVLNRILNPRPKRRECLFPNDLLKSKYEASNLDPLAPNHKRISSKGDKAIALKETCDPMLKKKIGERKT